MILQAPVEATVQLLSTISGASFWETARSRGMINKWIHVHHTWDDTRAGGWSWAVWKRNKAPDETAACKEQKGRASQEVARDAWVDLE